MKNSIEFFRISNGDYDITDVDNEMASIILSPLDMGVVYQRLIRDTLTSREDFVDGIIKIYNDEICDVQRPTKRFCNFMQKGLAKNKNHHKLKKRSIDR